MFSRINVVFWFSHVGCIGLVNLDISLQIVNGTIRHGIIKLKVLKADVQLPLPCHCKLRSVKMIPHHYPTVKHGCGWACFGTMVSVSHRHSQRILACEGSFTNFLHSQSIELGKITEVCI
jgi:hypothetical protein